MSNSILIADDDRDDIELFCEAVETIDPSLLCYTAFNGEKVFETLAVKEKPNLIFLDINMPVMGGWECLRLLKENESYKDIPVIMYSTSALAADLKLAEAHGAVDFISKPSDFPEIVKKLQEVLLKFRVVAIESNT